MWVRPEAYKVVGEILIAARDRAGVTQADLAKRLGKPQSFVSSYERGQRRIDVLELIVIIEALVDDPAVVFNAILNAARSGGAT